MVSLYVRHFCACVLYSHERFYLNKENQSNDGSLHDRCDSKGQENTGGKDIASALVVEAALSLPDHAQMHGAVSTRGMCA